jgi:hypothetical protein
VQLIQEIWGRCWEVEWLNGNMFIKDLLPLQEPNHVEIEILQEQEFWEAEV